MMAAEELNDVIQDKDNLNAVVKAVMNHRILYCGSAVTICHSSKEPNLRTLKKILHLYSEV
jgi:hypothetical protein